MNILLVNPPNCGRSIPEERFGIDSLKQIFRGEPLALEELAGNLQEHQVRIVDLKADPEGLSDMLRHFTPDLIGITGVTCEANTMLRLADELRQSYRVPVVVGGIHASNDPDFFNHPFIDYIVVGLGKKVFAELAAALEEKRSHIRLPGVIATDPGGKIVRPAWRNDNSDLVEERPPAYDLVRHYRSHYILERLNLSMGFVASAYGCPQRCSFCCIEGQTGGRYLSKSIDAVIGDIERLGPEIPVVRLVDANTFGDVNRARRLGEALAASSLQKHYLADIRSDTVVHHPELLRLWKKAGLRAVVTGFEEIGDDRLRAMNKANTAAVNTEAIAILNDLDIKIVGDFILSPDYDEGDFERLGLYLENSGIDLPMITVMTPLPGTALYAREKKRIINHDLDYYTLTNAITSTRLEEKTFYSLYAALLAHSHKSVHI